MYSLSLDLMVNLLSAAEKEEMKPTSAMALKTGLLLEDGKNQLMGVAYIDHSNLSGHRDLLS